MYEKVIQKFNDRNWERFKSDLGKSFRKAIKPESGEEHAVLMVPLDQISTHHNWIISQSNKQREVIINSTKLSMDSNHKCSPRFAECTLTLRALLHGKEWVSLGYVLCLYKRSKITL